MSRENIALFVGSGAVENAWKPILEALQPFHRFELNEVGANSMLANIVYYMRYGESIKQAGKQDINNAYDLYKSIKNRICVTLKAAQVAGAISARRELKEIIQKFVVDPNNVLVLVNTNWDEVVENEINSKFDFERKIDGIHVHGKMDDPEELYLPSEVSREPYRSKNQQLKYEQLHAEVDRLLEVCNTAIIYGLSLDPLDAELATVITSGLVSEDFKEIIIIDLKPEIVAQRLKIHFIGRKLPKILGYLPSDLNKELVL